MIHGLPVPLRAQQGSGFTPQEDVMTLPNDAVMSSSPFECPICYEVYDDGSRQPVTLPCGHSCCLDHVRSQALHNCMVGNQFAPLPVDIHTSYPLSMIGRSCLARRRVESRYGITETCASTSS